MLCLFHSIVSSRVCFVQLAPRQFEPGVQVEAGRQCPEEGNLLRAVRKGGPEGGTEKINLRILLGLELSVLGEIEHGHVGQVISELKSELTHWGILDYLFTCIFSSNVGEKMMMNGFSSITSVEGSSSFGQLDSVKENGNISDRAQPDLINGSEVGNGEMKSGDHQTTSEQSTFGTIFCSSASCGNDGALGGTARRPERLKIIVKRKVIADEPLKDFQAKSPRKKLKVDTNSLVPGENQGIELLSTSFFPVLPRQEVDPVDSRVDCVAREVGVETGYIHSTPPALGPFHTSDSANRDTDSWLTGSQTLLAQDASVQATSTSEAGTRPSLFDRSSETLSGFAVHQSRDAEDVGSVRCSVTGIEFAVPMCEVVEPARIGMPEEATLSGGGQYRAPDEHEALELGSPANRTGSGGAPEQTQTPKAKRTPLFFPSAERAAEDILRSSPSESPNPPAPPAKRSPLPLPSAGSSIQSQHNLDQAAGGDFTITNVDQQLSQEMTHFKLCQFRSNFVPIEHVCTGEIGATPQDGREGIGGEDENVDALEEQEGEEGSLEQVEAEDGEEVGVVESGIQVLGQRSEPVVNFCEMGEARDEEDTGEEEEEDGPEDLDDADLVDDEFVAGLKFDITDLDNDTSMNTAPAPVDDDKHIFRETFAPSEKAQIYMGYDTSYLSGTLTQDSALGDSRFSFQSLVNGSPYQVDKYDSDPQSLFQDKSLDLDQLESAGCFSTGGNINSHQSDDFVDEDGVSTPSALEGVNVCTRCGAQKTGRACECGSLSGEGDSREEDSLTPRAYSPPSVYTKTPATKKPVEKSPVGLNYDSYHGKKGADLESEESVKLVSANCTAESRKSGSGIKRIKVKMSSDVSFKQELRTPAKGNEVKDAPMNTKALLATRLLEGYHVKYIDRSGKIMLTGRIKGSGVICDCTKCIGQQVVNVSAFEKHAGSNARHPSDFIYLENGKNLHDVMDAGQKAGAAGRNVLEALQRAMEVSPGKNESNSSCAECGTGGTLIACSGPRCSSVYHKECAGLLHPPESGWLCTQCGNAENRKRLQKANSLPSRESSVGKQDSSANMHKALFVPGAPGELPDDSKVGYYVKGQCFLTGVKKGSGICCSCCNQVVSCSQFEQHAGWGSRRNPYSSIYLDDGRSLHCAALELSKSSDKTPVDNVDQCRECGDGGELVFCNGCPGAYHPECAGLVGIPGTKWFCPRCEQQQNTGCSNARRTTTKIRIKSGNKAGTPASKESPEDRCTHLLKANDTVVSGCVFCRSGEFAKLGFGPRTILLCDQCEREFHVGCLKEHGLANLTELPEGEWFCGKDCQHIHGILHLLVINGMEPVAGSIVSKVIERSKIGDASQEPSRFAWQLLHGRRGDPQNGKTLTEAAAIFSESFDPIVDESSGRDLIPLMVHSRSIRDQDFGGMFCVVLKRNDEVVTAALVRIFGRQFAELPLVATRAGSQGQGYCKALILSIERLLGVLNVERLVLPAAEGAEGIWVKKFGFSQLSDEESRKFRSEVQMMIFKGSSVLKKFIPPVAIQ
ncbi:hypothetical protein R1flu_010920 [Riccia fluitans]|uniref:PHD-type domain-containing protein n=1 Tax=Riccia fluitans TaxID=41844 RepID=A0ABD1Z6C0_9MARC